MVQTTGRQRRIHPVVKHPPGGGWRISGESDQFGMIDFPALKIKEKA